MRWDAQYPGDLPIGARDFRKKRRRGAYFRLHAFRSVTVTKEQDLWHKLAPLVRRHRVGQ